MKLLSHSTWLSSFNNALLIDNTSIFIGLARNSKKKVKAKTNEQLDEHDTSNEDENSNSFITCSPISSLKDGEETDFLSKNSNENR